MGRYLLRRVSQLLLVLVLTSAAVFLLIRLMPGDAARSFAGPFADDAVIAAVRHRMGLDSPLQVQYFDWLKSLASGNLGVSSTTGVPVSEVIGQAIPFTVQLAVGTFVASLAAGVTFGMAAGLRRGRWADRLVGVFNTAALGIPNFWLGLLLLLVFTVRMGVLPSSGSVSFLDDPVAASKGLILPVAALGAAPAAVFARFTRGAVIEVLGEDFIRTARAKGMRPTFVIRRHLLPHVALELLPIMAILVGSLLTGAVIIEIVFTIPGAGRLLIDASVHRDYPLLQVLVLLSVGVFVLVTFVADLLYAILDPRVRGQVIGEG